MANKKIIGIILAIVGIGLAYWGHQLSGGFGSQVNQAFTGSPTDKVMMLYIAAAASLIAGLFLLFRK